MVVRSATPATSLSGAIKSAIAAVDPDLPVARLETLEAHVSSSVAERRFYMVVLTIFAGVALALAAIGIFGVLSYLVSQRTREIGIRVALGAGRQSVIGMVVGQALALVGVGIAIGSVAALELGTYIRAMLFQLQPNDAWTFGLVAAGLATVGLLASWLPARRAVGIDPIVAIRAE
jgi:ABC-type antimicrobial peptide transport system permease subunit